MSLDTEEALMYNNNRAFHYGGIVWKSNGSLQGATLGMGATPYLFGFPDFDDERGFFAHAVCAVEI